MTADLVFARPDLLWLLGLLLPWVGWRRWAARRSATPWPALQLTGDPGRWVTVRPAAALAVEVALLAVLLVGAAGPETRRDLELVVEDGVDVILVLDVSLSMLATDLEPDRMAVLRRTAREFVDRMGEARIGIVVFAGDVWVQTPLTGNRAAVRRLLDSVTPHLLNQGKGGGTAIGDALLVAGDRLRRVRLPGRDQAVVLITDGESNVGSEPELAARWLRDEGIGLHIVGVGGREPVEVYFEGERVGGDAPYLAVLDDAALESVAAAGAGRWYRATDAGSLGEIFAELNRLESAPLERETTVLRAPAAAPWAAAAAGLFALHLFLGIDARRPLR